MFLIPCCNVLLLFVHFLAIPSLHTCTSIIIYLLFILVLYYYYSYSHVLGSKVGINTCHNIQYENQSCTCIMSCNNMITMRIVNKNSSNCLLSLCNEVFACLKYARHGSFKRPTVSENRGALMYDIVLHTPICRRGV